MARGASSERVIEQVWNADPIPTEWVKDRAAMAVVDLNFEGVLNGIVLRTLAKAGPLLDFARQAVRAEL